MTSLPVQGRSCLRDPVPEIFEAARFLDSAVSAHQAGRPALADELIRLANMSAIRQWSESLWGAGGPWTRPLPVPDPLPFVSKNERVGGRMPTEAVTRAALERDGFVCRFCGIPLITARTRKSIRAAYPDALPWGDRNIDQHAGFQAMWLQYDHVLPHARGGSHEIDNIVVTCAPCNNGRSNLTLEEVGLIDPRSRRAARLAWDGLERIHR